MGVYKNHIDKWKEGGLLKCLLYLVLGAVHKRRHQSRGEGGFAKRWSYLISLFSKSGYDRGEGAKILKKMATWFVYGP